MHKHCFFFPFVLIKGLISCHAIVVHVFALYVGLHQKKKNQINQSQALLLKNLDFVIFLGELLNSLRRFKVKRKKNCTEKAWQTRWMERGESYQRSPRTRTISNVPWPRMWRQPSYEPSSYGHLGWRRILRAQICGSRDTLQYLTWRRTSRKLSLYIKQNGQHVNRVEMHPLPSTTQAGFEH